MKIETLAERLTVDGWSLFLRGLRRIERAFNSLTCVVMNGGHELYVIRNNETRLFQRCLLCGHETKGWKLTPRRPQGLFK